MIKSVQHLQPGDIILWDGKPDIIESIQPGLSMTKFKCTGWKLEKRFENGTTFLVSETTQAKLINAKLVIERYE